MDVVRRADWVVDIGPGAGEGGGRVLYSGPVAGPGGGRGVGHQRTTCSAAPSRSTRPPAHAARLAAPARRLPAQPAGRVRRPAARRADRGDRRVRLREVDAGHPGAGRGRPRPPRRLEPDETPTRRGPARSEVDVHDACGARVLRPAGAWSTSGPSAARRGPTWRRTPGCSTRCASCTPRRDEARARGYGAGRFSFNVAAGRCETCQGEGFVSVELLFLPGTYAPCPTCHGARYNAETLEVTYRGTNHRRRAGDVGRRRREVPRRRAGRRPQPGDPARGRAGLPAARAARDRAQRRRGPAHQAGHRAAARPPRATRSTCSTSRPPACTPRTSTLLLRQLHRLVDAGNTVVLVEHDLDTIATADWVIDLGPGGGDAGGRVVAAGPPAKVAAGPQQRHRALSRGPARALMTTARGAERRSAGFGAQGRARRHAAFQLVADIAREVPRLGPFRRVSWAWGGAPGRTVPRRRRRRQAGRPGCGW